TYAGATMFETAVAEARAAYPGGCESAIIVGPGDAWVDALSVAGLSATRGPVLFTWKDSLHPATAQALADLGVKSVIVAGGPAAVSDSVVRELESRGVSLERRLGGPDCYGTQMAVYEYGASEGLWRPGLAIVATGGHFGDALSASPVAAAEAAPIFLARDGALPKAQADALGALASASRTEVAVAGGPAAVSDATWEQVRGLASRAGGTSFRLWGPTQYETSSEVASWAVSRHGFSWDGAAFATGAEPYDALAGSVLQGRDRSVLLLVGDYGSSTVGTIGAHKDAVSSVRYFGGEAAVSMRVRMGVADALGEPYASIPGFKVYLDAGHGDNDTDNGGYAPGAVANGYTEAVLTKELATMVRDILVNEYGVDVYLNDDGGWYKLRHAEAEQVGCDALVSIHFNAGGGTGSESLIHSYRASYLSQAWQDQIHPYLIEGVGLADRGKKQQEVAIIGGYLPAVLLEVCFIDNASDMSWYQSHKDYVAHKIAEGIVA
ncbi:cell wall-binding repeat-containing protein, partial [Adlercreutzia sp. ZJ242]|uniref:cell wall-binding repeat-containing protein n=1 Tax=Adlercreutzia sp. ZJ242 TaxID=2709409 RepID=UPI00197D2815